MKAKTIILLSVGGVTGFAAGNIFVIKKALSNDKIRQAVKEAVSDKIADLIFNDKKEK